MIIGLSLPHVWNGRFKAMTLRGPSASELAGHETIAFPVTAAKPGDSLDCARIPYSNNATVEDDETLNDHTPLTKPSVCIDVHASAGRGSLRRERDSSAPPVPSGAIQKPPRSPRGYRRRGIASVRIVSGTASRGIVRSCRLVRPYRPRRRPRCVAQREPRVRHRPRAWLHRGCMPRPRPRFAGDLPLWNGRLGAARFVIFPVRMGSLDIFRLGALVATA